MTYRSFALIRLGVATVILSVAMTSPAAEPPNVVFILTDDQGYGDLACHGNPTIRTPNLDRLYAESVRLTDFHVSPCCSLTRAQLMTGRYPSRTGVWHTVAGRSLLHRDEQTLADVFAANGYRTGIFGKWHLGDNYPSRPRDCGFQEVLIHLGGGVGNIADYWANDYYDDTYFRKGKPEQFKGYCTDVWFDEALRFIDESVTDRRPFFCYIPTNAPHLPYVVPDSYRKPYDEQGLPKYLANFFGMITNIDENVGRLRRHLKKLNVDENTILIFMTDNGTAAGRRHFNAGMRGGKGSPYDGGHRVPCFLHWPGGRFDKGLDIPNITAGIDLLPTLVDICKLQRPEGPPLDGTSLGPLLSGKGETWPARTLFVDNQRVTTPIKWRKTAVMTDRWRFVDGKELYAIDDDPGQETNLAAENPDVVAQLRRRYDAWWKSLKPAFERECEISLGSAQADPVVLTAHDLFGASVWNHDQVLAGKRCDGYWSVRIEQDGMYEFRLRRWPDEVDAPITASIQVPADLKNLDYFARGLDYAMLHDRSVALPATYARLKIGSHDVNRPIASNAAEVAFRVRLTAGSARLQTWFVNGANDGGTCGAYYVYVRRLAE